MLVLVMRHGEAMDAGTDSDAHRYLTRAGRRASRAVAERVVARGIAIDRIVTSPLVRAVQTAEIVAATIEHAGPIAVHAPLSPNGSTAAALSVLDTIADDQVVLLVSHEPTVRNIAGSLSGQGSGFPPFATSSIAILETDGTRGRLIAHLDS